MDGEDRNLGDTSTGIQPHVAGVLCYVLGWVTGLVFYLLERKNKFVRFHAMQSLVLFGGLSIVNIVALAAFQALGVVISALLSLLSIALWVFLMVKAGQGEYFKLPIVGDIADKRA